MSLDPNLIPVTAGGVVVGITVGIEAAKTTKASTKATALETTAAETALVHCEPAASEPAVVYREAAASETAAHRKPVTSEAATLNNGAGALTDCTTLQEAVLAWQRLAPEQKIRATGR